MAGAEAVFALSDAKREEVGLDGGGTVELPGDVGDGLDELGFSGAFGGVFVEEGMRVALVGGLVLSGQTMVWPVNPCRRALREERCLPAAVRGPVDFWALARLIAARSDSGSILGIISCSPKTLVARASAAGATANWQNVEREAKKTIPGLVTGWLLRL